MPLEVDQYLSTATTPISNRPGQPSQQYVVHTTVEGRRDDTQQRSRLLCRQLDDQLSRRLRRVLHSQRTSTQQGIRPGEQLPPVRQLTAMITNMSCPLPVRRPTDRQVRLVARSNRRPGLGKVLAEHVPGDTIHRQVMDNQQQPPTGGGLEPHRLQHHAIAR
jgi:hypothetical protein